jgi:uncharacterized membrane protein YkvA (DUF1232 family)
MNTKVFPVSSTSQIPSSDSFFAWLKKFLERLGRAAVTKALTVYYLAVDDTIPLDVRLAAGGALAYLALPLDLVPDFILPYGLFDDVAALTYFINTYSAYISNKHRELAKKTCDELFG